MVFVLIAMIAAILTMRLGSFIDEGKVLKNPIGSLLYILSDSREIMASLHSISELDTRERNRRVNEMKLGYRLGQVGDETHRPRIKITSTE